MRTITGREGQLRVGPYVAATLKGWRVAAGALTFQTAEVDPYWSTQPVTHVRLRVGTHTYQWRVTNLDVQAGGCPLDGPPEKWSVSDGG